MRRKLTALTLAVLLCAAALPVTAAGGEPNTPGVYLTELTARVTVTALAGDAANTPVVEQAADIDGVRVSFYPGAAALRFLCPADWGREGTFYLVRVQALRGDTVETVYIDQVRKDGAQLEFTVYPTQMEAGVAYHVYLEGAGIQKQELAVYRYYDAASGDVNGDGKVDEADAKLVLDYIVEYAVLNDQAKNAADLNRDGEINAVDAMLILQKISPRP